MSNSVYADYIAQQVAREEQRKASLENRAASTLTSCGAFATLLLGLITFTTKGAAHQLRLPSPSHSWVVGALALFAAAAVLAIATSIPVTLQWASVKGLRGLLDDWSDAPDVSEREVAENRLDLLESLRTSNNTKGWVLTAAMASEALAVVMIAVAVGVAL